MSRFRLNAWSITDDQIEETIMTALESQLAENSPRLTPEQDILFKRTEFVLGIYYRSIAQRQRKKQIEEGKEERFYRTM